VLLPVRDNMWEDYYSAVNLGRHVATVAKQFAVHRVKNGNLPLSFSCPASVDAQRLRYWHPTEGYILR
jgi:hypothetical protein